MDITEKVRLDLKNSADEKAKASFPRFFKEQVKFYGVSMAKIHQINLKYLPDIKKLSKKAVFDIAEDLLKSGYCEESWIAADWVYSINKQFEKSDFAVFKGWIEKYVTNWATCDTFCNHTMGSFIDMFPESLNELKLMSKSGNRWVKRASAVSLILPARQGRYLKDIFEIADILLSDKDDMVQKGYGWLLKEASKAYQEAVFNYVMLHKKNMPRAALRYAIEKMPQELKKKAMEK